MILMLEKWVSLLGAFRLVGHFHEQVQYPFVEPASLKLGGSENYATLACTFGDPQREQMRR